MKYSKPLTAAAVVTGLIVGGAGVAAAGNDGERNAEDGVEATEANALQVQLDEDGIDQDGDDENRDGDRRRSSRGARLSSVADVIGIEAEELRDELQGGATIADVAEANGVNADDVVDALVANVEERLDAKVEAGEITEEEAAEKLENKAERIANKVDGVENSRGEDDDADVEQANFEQVTFEEVGGHEDGDALEAELVNA